MWRTITQTTWTPRAQNKAKPSVDTKETEKNKTDSQK